MKRRIRAALYQKQELIDMKGILRNMTAPALVGALLLSPIAAAGEAEVQAQRFDSVFAALERFFSAAKALDRDELLTIFGSAGADLLDSGDPVRDREGIAWFNEQFEQKISLERLDSGDVMLAVGRQEQPFPIPLRHDGQGWYFDTEQGKEELINRRIGANELQAIAVMRAFVEAQYDYASLDVDGSGKHAYAQRIRSSEGQRDGLYWPVEEGDKESPMGPLVAAAEAKGYGKSAGDGSYYGYRFRLLTAQGEQAPGGARDYLEDGRLVHGFALLAYPAQYGVSGVMSFQVNHQGIVFQRDLGAQTEQQVAAIDAYNPDQAWLPVRDQ
jgi:hypothetical protein